MKSRLPSRASQRKFSSVFLLCAAMAMTLIACKDLVFAGGNVPVTGPDFDAATGYRIQNYRTPVPEQVPGAKTLQLDDLKAQFDSEGPVFVDVLGAGSDGYDPLDGTWISPGVRKNIPGSVWLPEVGRGFLEPELERYFRDQLVNLTGGDKTKMLVFYCIDKCWMSWNATIRAARWGYGNAYWFAKGTDAWASAGFPVEEAKPIPVGVE